MTKYLVVGAGLFGATFAYEAAKRGHEVKVIEKRDHIAGNIIIAEMLCYVSHFLFASVAYLPDPEPERPCRRNGRFSCEPVV